MRLAHLENNVVINISVGCDILPGTVRICDMPCCDIVSIYYPISKTFNKPEPSAEEIREIRKRLYPPLTEFADAYYWSIHGDSSKMDAYIAACDAVKNLYPLPS